MSLRTYEALFIVNPELEDDAIQTVADNAAKVVTDNGGSTVRLDIWGKRRLAYTVKKFTEGCYVLFRFEADPSVLPKLEAHFRLSDPIIRHMVVHFDEKTLRLEAEQLQRKEEEILHGGEHRREEDDDDDRPRHRGDREDSREPARAGAHRREDDAEETEERE
ncbi:MAG: 30S ribosomal protein S6 [Candidatus Hydrogenedentota bacterium]